MSSSREFGASGTFGSPVSTASGSMSTGSDLCYFCCQPRGSQQSCEACGPGGHGRDPDNRGSLEVGSILNGQYRVGRVLGHGGFGVTYLVYDENLKRRSVIKEFFPRELVHRDPATGGVQCYSDQAEAFFVVGLERFIEEAQVLARFEHPAVVRVLSYFHENGTGYIVMPYLKGRTLEDELSSCRGPLSESQVRPWLQELLSGLSVVHENGLLHRDIKPANLYLTTGGQLVLLDFGSARPSESVLSSNTKQYTPGYAPPEQTGIENDNEGPWTDIYGVGATAFKLLTATEPPDSLQRLRGMPVPKPEALGVGNVSDEMVAWWERCLELVCEDRFSNATEASAALGMTASEWALPASKTGTRTPRSTREGASPQGSRSAGGGMLRWVLVAAIALAVLGGGVLGWQEYQKRVRLDKAHTAQEAARRLVAAQAAQQTAIQNAAKALLKKQTDQKKWIQKQARELATKLLESKLKTLQAAAKKAAVPASPKAPEPRKPEPRKPEPRESLKTNVLGRLYYAGGLRRYKRKDYKGAAEAFLKGCRGRHPKACEFVGYLYKWGWGGLPQSQERALSYFKRAARLALVNKELCPGCLVTMGWMHETGYSGVKNERLALLWYLKACSLNDGFGCGKAARLFKVNQQKSNALLYYRRGILLLSRECQQGKRGSCKRRKLLRRGIKDLQ